MANVVQPGDVMNRVGVEVIRARGEPGHAPYRKSAPFYIPG